MTTETTTHTLRAGVRVLLGSAAVALIVGLATVVAAVVSADAPAVRGAAVGAAMALGVFALGALTVDLVAAKMPAASMLVALLTYTLEVLVLGLIFWRLAGSGLLDDALSSGWLAGAVIVVTLGWLVGQVALTARARIPLYDLASDRTLHPSVGGER